MMDDTDLDDLPLLVEMFGDRVELDDEGGHADIPLEDDRKGGEGNGLAQKLRSFTLSAAQPPNDPEDVLDAVAGRARTLTRQARAALLAAVEAAPYGQALTAARRWADEWSGELAELLGETRLAAILHGMDGIASQLDADTLPLTGQPELAEDSTLPLVKEAANRLAGMQLLGMPGYLAAKESAQNAATVEAEQMTAEAIGKVRSALARSIEEGGTLAEFKADLKEAFSEGVLTPDHVTEQVFRTNVMAAYSDGQERLLADPLVGDLFPYRAYYATHDDRTREEHLGMEKHGIDGTNIYRADDPVWQMFRPPWDYQCRCTFTPVSVAEAARRGIPEAQQWLSTGVEPATKAHVPMPPWKPDAEFANRGVELSVDPDYPVADLDDWSEPTGYELAAPDSSRYQQRKVTRGPRKGQTAWYDSQRNRIMPASWKPAGEKSAKAGAAGKDKAQPKPTKVRAGTVDEIHDAIQTAKASGKPASADDVRALAERVKAMKADDIKALRAKSGLTKTTGKGTKEVLADDLARKMLSPVPGKEKTPKPKMEKPQSEPAPKQPKEKPIAMPDAKTTQQRSADPFKGHPNAGKSVEDVRKDIVTFAREQSSVKANTNPLGLQSVPAPPQVMNTAMSHVVAALKANSFKNPKISELYELTKKAHPELTVKDFQSALLYMHGDGKIRLMPHTQSPGMIPDDRVRFVIPRGAYLLDSVQLGDRYDRDSPPSPYEAEASKTPAPKRPKEKPQPEKPKTGGGSTKEAKALDLAKKMLAGDPAKATKGPATKPAGKPLTPDAPAALPTSLHGAKLTGLGNDTGNVELLKTSIGGKDYVVKPSQHGKEGAERENRLLSLARKAGLTDVQSSPVGKPSVPADAKMAKFSFDDDAWAVHTKIPGRHITDEDVKNPAIRNHVAADFAFNWIAGNFDRNDGNFLVDDAGKVHSIDFDSPPEHQPASEAVSAGMLSSLPDDTPIDPEAIRRVLAIGDELVKGADDAAPKRLEAMRKLASKDRLTIGDLKQAGEAAPGKPSTPDAPKPQPPKKPPTKTPVAEKPAPAATRENLKDILGNAVARYGKDKPFEVDLRKRVDEAFAGMSVDEAVAAVKAIGIVRKVKSKKDAADQAYKFIHNHVGGYRRSFE